MQRLIVLALLCLSSVAHSQPVTIGWRPPAGCDPDDLIKWNGTAWTCGTVFTTLNAIPKGDGSGMVASHLYNDDGSTIITGGNGTLAATGGIHLWYASNVGSISSTHPGTANRELGIFGNPLKLYGNSTLAVTVNGADVSIAGSLTSGDAAGDVFDHNGDLAKFGATNEYGAVDGAVYVYGNQLNWGYGTNNSATGYINYAGYNNGVTQFRDLVLADGKGATACTLTGSTKTLNCVGGLQVNGAAVPTGTGSTNYLARWGSASTLAQATGIADDGASVTVFLPFGTQAGVTLGNDAADVHTANGQITFQGGTLNRPVLVRATPSGATTHGYAVDTSIAGTVNTTAGNLEAVALYGSSTGTRSAGANTLTNYGVQGIASGAQVNVGVLGSGTEYSFLGSAGTLYNAANTQLGDASTDAVGIGIAPDSNHAMTLAAAVGNKLALYPVSSTAAFGFGVQAGQLQYYTDASTGRHSFGYGDSDAFTEAHRLEADGDSLHGISNANTHLLNGIVGIGASSPGASDPLYVVANQNASTRIAVVNTTSGANAQASFAASRSATYTTDLLTFGVTGSLFAAPFSDVAYMQSTGQANGLKVGTGDATPVAIYTGGGANARLVISGSGAVSTGDTASTTVGDNLDVLTLGNTGTGQTANTDLLNASHSGTFDASAASRTAVGVRSTITAGLSATAGTNTLTNIAGRFESAGNADDQYGVYAVATAPGGGVCTLCESQGITRAYGIYASASVGGGIGWSGYFDQGDFYVAGASTFNGGMSLNATLSVAGDTTLSGKIQATGTDPTLSSCGTSPTIVGSDLAGTVTVGTGTATSCTVTFASSYTDEPVCVATSNSNNANPLYFSAKSATAFTVSTSAGTNLAGQLFNFVCFKR